MKEYFKVSTRTIVATGLGAAIFTLLFIGLTQDRKFDD